MGLKVLEDLHTYCVFTLGVELYSLEVEKIREIRVGYRDQENSVAPIKPPVFGAMVQGQEIIPIIDLPFRLGTKKLHEKSQAKTIIVVETVLNEQKKIYGVKVDSLLEIMNVRIRDIITTSLFGPDIKQYFISSRLSHHKEVVKIIVIASILEEIESLL